MAQRPTISIVTGANSGIGKEVASGLMQRGDHCVLACRRIDACEAAKQELLSAHPTASCECMHLDLADFASIRAFASTFSQTHSGEKVSVLVNNGAVMGVQPCPDNGEDQVWLINHLGPYLLTRLLLPHMGEHSRIVTVGSEAHRRGSVAVKQQQLPSSDSSTSGRKEPPLELAGPHPTNWYRQYARSKLGNSLMATELARRLDARGSTVKTSCVSPGRVATGIFANVAGLTGVFVSSLASLFFQTPTQGAFGVLRAAAAPEFAGRHVEYLHMGEECEPSKAAKDAGLAAQLWELSSQSVGMTPAEEEALWPRH